jgi:hypothetical protein
MKRPSIRSVILGHPAVGVPVALASVGALYVCWFRGAEHGAALGLIPVAMLFAVGKASQEMTAYRAWKREWDAMAPTAPERRTGRFMAAIGLLLGAVVLIGGVASSDVGPIIANHLLGWGLVLAPFLLGMVAVRSLTRRLRHRSRRGVEGQPAAVIAKPILPAPALPAAYAALPAYCQRLLGEVSS